MRGLRLGVLLAWSGLLAACPAAPPVPCVTCGTECVDTQNDPRHCGSCGQVCRTGETCRAGVCGCGTGQALCGSTCTNLQTDSTNCGACGTTCPLGRTCVSGMCGCATGQSPCGNACFNLQTDRANCGACGNTCRTEEGCVDGVCRTQCPSSFSPCGLACFNLSIDRNNCGRCGNACTTAQTCVNGSCEVVCPAGQTACGMTCADLNTSADHCGGCNMPCAPSNAAGAACQAGRCDYTACDAGFSDCDGDRRNGCERATSADISNCGACGNVCRPVNVATAGSALDASVILAGGGIGTSACQSVGGIPCFSVRLPDGGPGVSRRPDYPSGVACVASACGYTSCIEGFLDCDGQRANGCETSGQTDSQNCGSCSRRCATDESCVRGTCQSCRRSVLLLADGLNAASTPALELALRAAGYSVTTVAPPSYTGTPAASGFGAVVLSPGGSFGTDMPSTGQTAVASAIGPRTGLVITEWVGFQVQNARYTGLARFLAFTRSSGNTTGVSYAAVEPFHPIWEGLPASFAAGSAGINVGSLVPDAGVLIARCDSCGGPGVAVRSGVNPRVAQVAHAAGFEGTWYTEPNMLKMLVNAVDWAAGCK